MNDTMNAGVKKPLPFTKHQRLLSPNDFKAVFDTPVKKIHSTHFLLFVANTGQPHARLGLAITKKKLKKAVDRNLVKRHTREIFRLNQHNLPPLDCVLIVKSGAFVGNKKQKVDQRVDKETSLAIIKTELGEIFSKLAKLNHSTQTNPISTTPINQTARIDGADKSKMDETL